MEIGGGFLMLLYFLEKWAWRTGAEGALRLVIYCIVPTFQPEGFGIVYAAYGKSFFFLLILWDRAIDGVRPDIYDRISG